MNLTKEQQEIYDGKQGATLAKVTGTIPSAPNSSP